MRFLSITLTILMVAWTSAGFTLDHGRRSIMNPTNIHRQMPFQHKSRNKSQRSMVAMEPERASGNEKGGKKKKNAKKDVPTFILKPDEFHDKTKDFEEWEGTRIPKEEMLGHEDIEMKKDTTVEIPEGTTSAAAAAMAAAERMENRSKTDFSKIANHNIVFRVMNRVLGPIFGREIEKNVPKKTIQGAWITGAFVSMMGGLDPVTSLFSATGFSYIAITPGIAGGFVRAAGEATWDSGLVALKVAKNISSALGVDTTRIPNAQIVVDDDIETIVKDAENTVAEVENALQHAKEEIEVTESPMETAERLAEEARLAEIEYLLEEARIEKETKELEAEFLAEEAALAEEERLAEIALELIDDEPTLMDDNETVDISIPYNAAAKLAYEKSDKSLDFKTFEEQYIADAVALVISKQPIDVSIPYNAAAKLAYDTSDKSIDFASFEKQYVEDAVALVTSKKAALENELRKQEDEERLADEARLAELARIAEEERLAEEARLAEEDEDDDDVIDDDEWEASIMLAEGLSPDLAGEKVEWDAARQLAKDLVDEADDEVIDFNAPGLTDEERMELIGKAARAAVEQFEASKQEENDLEEQAKARRNEMKAVLEKEGVNGLEKEVMASDVSSSNAESSVPSASQSYEKMTVVMLKDVLRSRGLKVSGRKVELIERLKEDDEA